MIKSITKRQIFRTRNDAIRCFQQHYPNFRRCATSPSFSLSPRRRPRMWQVLSSYDDNFSRILLSLPSFKTIRLNEPSQNRTFSLSISSDDDIGETIVGMGSNAGETSSDREIHELSEIGINKLPQSHSESSAGEVNNGANTLSIDPESSPIQVSDESIGYDVQDGRGSEYIDSGNDVGRKTGSDDVIPLSSSLFNQPSEQDRVLGENYDDVVESTDLEPFSTSERLDHSCIHSDLTIMFDNKDRGVVEKGLKLSNNTGPPQKHPLVSRLIKCIHNEDVGTSILTFNKIMELNHKLARKKEPTIDIQPGLTKALIYLVEPEHPLVLYRIIKYYISLPTTYEKSLGGTVNDYKKYYRIACDSIRNVNPKTDIKKDVHLFILDLMTQIGKLDQSGKEMCVPILLSAICMQPFNSIGEFFGRQVYRYMIEQKISVPAGYWLHLLSLSRYNRQNDVPYDVIFTKAVSLGLRPDPTVALNAIENFFPFSNLIAITNVLKALVTLQRQVAADIKAAQASGQNIVAKQYCVDIHLLETIGAAAASQGQSEINLLIWDMLDVLEYTPTIGIYENTVVAFAMNAFTYREAFTVMSEMETLGYHPSRALIRSFSVHVRDSIRNMDFAQLQVMQLRQENKIKISTSIMNVLMSSAAERGDIDRLLSILKDFQRYKVAFDADTISFGFESLGKNLLRRRKFNSSFLDLSRASTRDHIDACMVVANVLLNHMDDNQVKTSDHIIRNYIEFLCMAGHVDTATNIILEAVHEKGLVSTKSLYRVAMANAKLFRFDVARQVATCDPSIAPFTILMEAIDREEKLFNVSLKQQLVKDKKATHASVSDFDLLPICDEENTGGYDRSNSQQASSSFWQQQSTFGNEE